MKIVVYINKNDNSINEISQLKENHWQILKESDKLESFNSNEKNNRKAMIFDTDVDDIPKDIFQKMLELLCGFKQVSLRKVLDKLSELEYSIDDLRSEFDGVTNNIKEVLGDEKNS